MRGRGSRSRCEGLALSFVENLFPDGAASREKSSSCRAASKEFLPLGLARGFLCRLLSGLRGRVLGCRVLSCRLLGCRLRKMVVPREAGGAQQGASCQKRENAALFALVVSRHKGTLQRASRRS
jgi:hypothetical protein